MTTALGRHLSGLAAEDIAERHYCNQGATVLERRARGEAGEIDLIVGFAAQTVFVEVKARKSLEIAAASVSPNQAERIVRSAQEWLGRHGRGEDMRFDIFLVDRYGATHVIENALFE